MEVKDIAGHAFLLVTLQQEAEPVLAQQDDWSAKGQGSQAGQVGWAGPGRGLYGALSGYLLYLAYLALCLLTGQPPRPQISGITLEQLGS